MRAPRGYCEFSVIDVTYASICSFVNAMKIFRISCKFKMCDNYDANHDCKLLMLILMLL